MLLSSSLSKKASLVLLLLPHLSSSRYVLPRRPIFPSSSAFGALIAAMPPRKRAAAAASASSGSEYEASPSPKKSAKTTAATSKAAKAKKKPADDGPVGLAPGWVKHGNYVVAKVYGSPAASAKVVAFDLDSTLVVEGLSWRRERNLGPSKPGDFLFFRAGVPAALRAAAERGEHVAVFSNQGTIRGALDGKNARKHTRRMDLVHEAIGKDVPMTAVFATASKAENDPHRKPGRGMWDLFCSKLAPSSSSSGGGAAPDASQSTFVGDAAGRLSDFADSDKGFAEAVGFGKFQTPEEYFGGPSDVASFDSGWKGVLGAMEEEDEEEDEDGEGGKGGGGTGAGTGGGKGGKGECGSGGKKGSNPNDHILRFFSRLCDAYKADAAARGDEGMKNLGFKLGAANKAAASFRNLREKVTSIDQVKALVKAKELPGVGKASVERLQQWFETGTCDLFAALDGAREQLAGAAGAAAAAVVGAAAAVKKEEEAGAKSPAAAGVAVAASAAAAAAAAAVAPKEEEEDNCGGALAFA